MQIVCHRRFHTQGTPQMCSGCIRPQPRNLHSLRAKDSAPSCSTARSSPPTSTIVLMLRTHSIPMETQEHTRGVHGGVVVQGPWWPGEATRLRRRLLLSHATPPATTQGRSSFDGSPGRVRGMTRPTFVDGCEAAGVRFQTTRFVTSDTLGGVTTGWSWQPSACEARSVGGWRESNERTTAWRVPVRLS